MKKKVLIPVFLAAIALPVCLNKGASSVNADYIGEFGIGQSKDRAAYIEHASKVQDQLAEEGFVLLKNKDNYLPRDTQGMKVSLAGKSSVNLARGGAGSGSGSVSSGVADYQLVEGADGDVKGALNEVGMEINPTLVDFYGTWTKSSRGGVSFSNNSKSGSGRSNGNDGWKGNSEVVIGETPLSSYTDDILASLDEYNDAAIQVITREGSEGCDVKTCNAHDTKKTNSSAEKVSDRHALQLSENEEALLEELGKHTDNIIVIINSSNIFECEQLQNNDKVKAIIWVGNPGDRGIRAVGRIINGQVNPSGRTVDTWARDFREDPTFQNFSDNSQTNEVTLSNGKTYYAPQDTMFAADGAPMLSYGTDKNYKQHSAPRWDTARGGEEAKVVSGGINGVKPAAYVSYEEGIYVDYRYYETKYADMAKADKAAADAWYNGNKGVLYPFGYGLSYTTFEQKIVKTNIKKGGTVGENNKVVALTVEVKNTGSIAGKEAVQLYFKAPYTAGGIEKADHVLCAFGKTGLIQPGKTEKVELSFYLQDVANYDFTDANKNGFAGYELEKGDYELLLGKNAHENFESFKFKIASDIKYENDRFSGHKVENRFTNNGFYDSMPGENDIEFTQMSRADFDGTFPTHPTFEDRTVKANSRFEEFLTYKFSLEDFENGNNEYIPAAARKDASVAANWEQGSKATEHKIKDLIDVPMDDPRWEEIVNQMSWNDMLKIVETNQMSSKAIDSVGKGGFSEGDGPQKFNIMWWVSSPIIAATFNQDLAHKQGECVGMESHISGKSGWWGPAVNTHRSPFGGRNFEYYAADPFLMGRMAAQVVGAATDRGVYAYFKHFAVNDQEKNRESGISFLTEQALREIYLKSFQMVFEEGKSIGVMGSYNRMGLMETAANYNLLTEVLRGEWGFKGSVLSDMTHSGNGSVDNDCYECVTNRVLAGCNAQLDSGGFSGHSQAKWDSTLKAPVYTNKAGEKVISYSYWYAVRQCSKEHLYMSANCTATNRVMVPVVGEEYKTVEARKDFTYDVAIEGAAEIKLNHRVDTPEGLTINGGSISGKVALEGVYHLDFVGYDADGNAVGAFKLILTAATGDGGAAAKKGCFGDIAACSAIISLVAIAGAGLLLVSLRKKRRA
jgi:beta-glucosidase